MPDMDFSAGAAEYDRFMGRYSGPLAPRFADFAGITSGQRVLDVGCGPGALTGELVRRLGPAAVCAVDPAKQFVETVRDRYAGVLALRGAAESLPFGDRRFEVTLAQLVVHFMADPLIGLREMARVTSPDGTVAACVWDHAGGQGPLSLFWDTAHELLPNVRDESALAGTRRGHLAALFDEAGMHEIQESTLTVEVGHQSFDEWWQPYTLGVGPAGELVAQLDPTQRARLRELCRKRLPAGRFAVSARAWSARGLV